MGYLYRIALVCLAFLACVAYSPAFAQAGYSPMPEWGAGGFRFETFNGGSSGNYNGRAVARLDSGNYVVAGDIYGGTLTTVRNLGLVKYDALGQRVPWPDVSPKHAIVGKQYVVFPNRDLWGTTRQIVQVHDIKVSGSLIYVLLTFMENGVHRPAIVRWSESGGFRGWWSFAPADATGLSFGVSMDILGRNIVVLGARSLDINSSDGGYWVTRLTINNDESITLGSITTFSAGSRIIPADIAFERRTLLLPVGAPAYYVAYTVRSINSQATWPCIHKVGSNNASETDFGSNGYRCNPWLANDTNLYRDGAVALHTRLQSAGGFPVQYKEVLHLSALVSKPASGIGLLRLVDGVPDTSWGASGLVNFGGCMSGNGEGCSTHPNLGDTSHIALPGALHADSTGVYVAGRTFTPVLFGTPQLPPQRRPIFAHVSDDDGTLLSLQEYVPGSNSRFTAFAPGDLVAGHREFVAVGLTHYQNTQTLDDGPTQIIATRLLPRLDLFSDGFEN